MVDDNPLPISPHQKHFSTHQKHLGASSHHHNPLLPYFSICTLPVLKPMAEMPWEPSISDDNSLTNMNQITMVKHQQSYPQLTLPTTLCSHSPWPIIPNVHHQPWHITCRNLQDMWSIRYHWLTVTSTICCTGTQQQEEHLSPSYPQHNSTWMHCRLASSSSILHPHSCPTSMHRFCWLVYGICSIPKYTIKAMAICWWQ